MPRIRTVKPGYPKHRKTRQVSRDARLLNIHLWNLADDEGRLQELPQWIIGEVFPTDEDVTPDVLRGWLTELQGAGLIVRYEVGGERYIQCHDFDDHQVISRPKPSDIPPCPAEFEPSRSDHGAIHDESAPEVEGEREEEVEGNEERARATELAPVSDNDRRVLAVLQRVTFSRSLPDPKVPAVCKANADFADRDLGLEADKFAHYWIDGAGENRRMRDVVATWRNWLRNAPRAGKARSGGGARDSVAADLERLEAEKRRLQAEEAIA